MNFSKKLFEKFNNNKDKHKIIAVGYAFIIFTAFLFSISNNSNVVASVSKENIHTMNYNQDDYLNDDDYIIGDIQYLEEKLDSETTVEEKEFTSIRNQEKESSLSKISYLKNMFKIEPLNDESGELQPAEILSSIEHKVKSGDNFIGILTQKANMSYNDASIAIAELKKIYNPAKLKVGQRIKIDFFEDTKTNEIVSVEKISIDDTATKRFVLVKNIEEKFISKIEEDSISTKLFEGFGKIEGNLSSAMNSKDVPSSVIADFINIFSFSVDFRRDLRIGDEFEIIYEQKVNNKNKIVGTGNILYASLKLRNDKLSLYRYEAKNGKIDYYTEAGIALKKNLDRKPIAFKNARVSSSFGKRRHPILKTVKAHWGVDYAAPRGTAIYAGGDGVVEMAKYNGGYGNYVKIRHNSEYSTAYGHMHNIAKGVRSGTRVKQGQIIGYVGSTGRSTGPHLHYEVIRNGKRVNPQTIRAATGENLKGNTLKSFKENIAEFKTNNNDMFAMFRNQKDKDIASAE